ncbi:tyrosine-type recombinase/integrase [Nocardia sp. NPDC052566]|uniref:tyrosine-type recombinase/integrase n=1 Tax=Nocardia sp. NPDC052566 TaxID=3364330 RepID=UPI0037CC7AED
MANDLLPLCTPGTVNCTQQANGRWRARCRFRRYNGETIQLEARGGTEKEAGRRLNERIRDEQKGVGGRGKDVEITRNTKLSALADLWLAELESQVGTVGGTVQQTVDKYRREIKQASGKRAKSGTIKIDTHLGKLRVFEATTSRLDAHLKMVADTGKRRKAQLHKLILNGMMGLAARHDAVPTNPVKDVAAIRRRRSKPRALSIDELADLREQMAAWLRGEAIPGTPEKGIGCHTYKSGPPRSRAVVDAFDILLGTGARPGEGLALRRCDVDLSEDPVRVVISGTLIRTDSGGLNRQGWTKTDDGYRALRVPKFTAAALERRCAGMKPDSEELIFRTRKGTPWEPNNLRRTWRVVRGAKYAWVQLYNCRDTALTLVAEEAGAEQASKQGGHRHLSTTERHYIDRPNEAPDSSALLERLGGNGHRAAETGGKAGANGERENTQAATTTA